jgi:4-amino-4-deoxy-L-arabinose transferase-like glycosyltransferase
MRNNVDACPPRATRPSTRRDRAWLGVVLCIHAGLLVWGASRHSPTMDEPAYLAAGVSHWRFGRFDLTKVSPPLVRLVAAVPVYFSSHVEDWGNYRIGPGVRAEHSVGRDFMTVNADRAFWLFTIARWACIPFSLLGACVCYRWSLELWGRRSAFASLLLWCFSPNVLAHGQMLTPDIGVTALSLVAAYLYWRWSLVWSWRGAALAGCLLGASVLAKTNAVVLLVVLPVLALLVAIRGTAVKEWRRPVSQLVLSLVTAVYVMNLGYGFEGSFERLDRYEFASRTFRGPTKDSIGNRFRNTALGMTPIPFPKAFLEGIDLQRRDFENGSGRTMTYFRGTWYDHGWWWYYLYASAVKVPLGAWALLFISCGIQIFGAGLRSFVKSEVLFVVVPGAALFAIASSQTGFGHALRYVLPAFPFAFVFASGAFRDTVRSRLILTTAAICLTWHVASSLSVFPHSLAYFNELAGGPVNGHAHLLDGNLDWGQDLLYLDRWKRAHPDAKPIHVGFWGATPVKQLMPPDFSDLEFEQSSVDGVPLEIPPGWYAISVNQLRQDFRMGKPKYASFLNRTPVAMAGYSIYIYQASDPADSHP